VLSDDDFLTATADYPEMKEKVMRGSKERAKENEGAISLMRSIKAAAVVAPSADEFECELDTRGSVRAFISGIADRSSVRGDRSSVRGDRSSLRRSISRRAEPAEPPEDNEPVWKDCRRSRRESSSSSSSSFKQSPERRNLSLSPQRLMASMRGDNLAPAASLPAGGHKARSRSFSVGASHQDAPAPEQGRCRSKSICRASRRSISRDGASVAPQPPADGYPAGCVQRRRKSHKPGSTDLADLIRTGEAFDLLQRCTDGEDGADEKERRSSVQAQRGSAVDASARSSLPDHGSQTDLSCQPDPDSFTKQHHRVSILTPDVKPNSPRDRNDSFAKHSRVSIMTPTDEKQEEIVDAA